jgi:hypothetical protein
MGAAFHAVYGEHEATIDMGSGATGRNSWRIGTARDRGSPWNASRRWSSDMDALVLEARYVRDHIVWLRFRDGTCGEIDVGPELHGPMFEPLRDVTVF